MPAINYAKVATEEGGSARRESDGPFATPPMMNRPVVWGVVCIVVLGLGYMLTGSPPTAPGANLVATLTPTGSPEALWASPSTSLRGAPLSSNSAADSVLEGVMAENAKLRAELSQAGKAGQRQPAAPVAAASGVSDAAFSSLFEENAKLRAQLAAKGAPAASLADFDIGAYRASKLAALPPGIIECAEAAEGGSQDLCHLSTQRRFEAIGQKGITLWMTGLSGSGKSTIARALEEELVLRFGKTVQMLDGDNVRTGLNRDLGFSPADRDESVRRVGELACLFNGGGVITLVTLVSPYREARDAARKRHEEQGLKFLEVFMNVPISVVQERDPKGLYAKVASGELTGFTGMSADAPYEAPLNPDVDIPNWDLTLDECVAVLMERLRVEGALIGGPHDPSGLPLPPGYVDAWLEDELILTGSSAHAAKSQALATLPAARLTDIDVNWLHVLSEGWAAPLRGFLREGPLLQALHFNSVLIDPFDDNGAKDQFTTATDWNDYKTRATRRASISVPIVLPITQYTKNAIESSGSQAVALVDKDGRALGVLRNPEIYVNRKEEIVSRCFGAIDPGHPYIKHIYEGGDWLLGGEIELFEKITYNDGLDKWRLTPKEMFEEFKAKKADVVFAFQTRNPTHAGHAYLMRTGRERLIARGYTNPVLWLSPLGGWTKWDDVPLDVRVKQHQAVLDEKMLDPAWTVMGIWPAPMIYGGPTEVQFHAASRAAAGASFFVVGRDAAGIKGSEDAAWNPDDDMYDANHARYALQMSPVLDNGQMQLLSFDKFFYDKTDHTMKAMDESRPDDFISISGSKMRKLAAQGATPCADPIPSDLLAANCVPQGFMVPSGWAIVCDYYQNIESPEWVPWSKAVTAPSAVSVDTVATGAYGTTGYALFVSHEGKQVSPWHDVPLKSSQHSGAFNMVTEIPMYTSAKMEVMKDKWSNPIMQDTNKDGSPRYYTYGVPFFNYGLLPQTWEDPLLIDALGFGGDNDPLDVIEIGSGPLDMGSVTPVYVIGSLELIDEGETDHKIIAIRASDPRAQQIKEVADLEKYLPGITANLVDWLKMYKTSDGKGVNFLANDDQPLSANDAVAIIDECNGRWAQLVKGNGGAGADAGFWLGADTW